LTENSKAVRLLVVSRDPAVLRTLDPMEQSPAWQLETVSNGWEAMERMQSGTNSHVLVLDTPVQDSEPVHFLRWLRCFRPDFPVILLCSPEDAGRVKETAGLEGEDMLYKPFDAKYLETVIRKRMDLSGNAHADLASTDIARKNIEPLGNDAYFVSASLTMQKLRAQAALLAKSDVPVLIVGESGAGKYTVASLIHKLSVRSGFELQRVNCAALPEAELVAELFGDNGVSTSPQTSLGKFAAGETGTIFLEEIAEMPAAVQIRLLQVLQNQALQNQVLHNQALHNNEIGTSSDSNAMPPGIRILAGSSANLDSALAKKQLREDLYHRLSAFTLHVPPLRQRKEEIATLLRHFMHHLSRHYGLPARGFSPSIVAACQLHAWPGNLNELETFVKRYLVTGEPESIFRESRMDANGGVEPLRALRALKTGAASPEDSAEELAQAKPESLKSLKSLIQGVKWEAERNAIAAALLQTGWNRKAAARMLKVSYRTMLYKIEQYKMRAPQPYLSPVPAGEFSGYETGFETKLETKSETKYDTEYDDGHRGARYAKIARQENS
jgi:two-component system, NtrC family, response regulator AtoC